MSTKVREMLNDPKFAEALDFVHKGFIDSRYVSVGKPIPVPETLVPLSYADERIQKGLNQLRQGAKNALYALDRHNDK